MTPLRPANTQRDLLVKLGIGHFNATQIIPYMLTQPATTDPRMPAVMLLVRAIQQGLYKMGATEVPNSGYLDEPTAAALTRMFGGNEGWVNMTWAQVAGAVATGVQNRYKLGMVRMPVEAPMVAASGFGDEESSGFSFPGGVAGYLGAAAVAHYVFKPKIPGGLPTTLGGAALVYYLMKR